MRKKKWSGGLVILRETKYSDFIPDKDLIWKGLYLLMMVSSKTFELFLWLSCFSFGFGFLRTLISGCFNCLLVCRKWSFYIRTWQKENVDHRKKIGSQHEQQSCGDTRSNVQVTPTVLDPQMKFWWFRSFDMRCPIYLCRTSNGRQICDQLWNFCSEMV